ncbi:MAG: peroxiredoxin [Alcaligenaceae bacterium]|nr:peroxiredoxin [Alcaligenaceae bacterium]
MQCTVEWNGPEGMLFVSRTGSGHVVAMDGAPEGGGNNLAPRPMEMILTGAAGCAAYDVVLILKRSRQEVLHCNVAIDGERAETDPKVFTKIHFVFTVKGKGLSEKVVERAVNLSHTKYCSAVAMLEKTAEITHEIKILEA